MSKRIAYPVHHRKGSVVVVVVLVGHVSSLFVHLENTEAFSKPPSV
jgi:hypothetical protein